MPSLEFFIVAQSVSIDQATNLLSILEVVEEVAGTDPPIIPSLALVAAWNIEPADMGRQFVVSFRVLYEDGQCTDIPALEFVAGQPRQRNVVRIGMLPTRAFGTIRFEVLLDGEHRAEHRLTVRPMTEAELARPTLNPPDAV